MKRILALLLVTVMTMTVFVSCTKTKDVIEENKAPHDSNASQQKENIPDDNNKSEPAEGSLVFTKENYPKMGGSLANLPLGEAVTATVLGIDREEANSMVSFKGSTTDNYVDLVDGKFDILLAYEMSEEAIAYVEENNVELEMTPIGMDAFVFINSIDNDVTNLTEEQIKEIYKGNITNWSEVGGDDHDIIAYQRNKDSGSQTLFDLFINLGDELMEPPADVRIGSMIGILKAVADYENNYDALGYTVYYYNKYMESEKLDTSKFVAVDGVMPSNETIASGEYPYVNDFYVVIRKDAAEDSPERILYNWICSQQGKELAKRENYVVKP